MAQDLEHIRCWINACGINKWFRFLNFIILHELHRNLVKSRKKILLPLWQEKNNNIQLSPAFCVLPHSHTLPLTAQCWLDPSAALKWITEEEGKKNTRKPRRVMLRRTENRLEREMVELEMWKNGPRSKNSKYWVILKSLKKRRGEKEEMQKREERAVRRSCYADEHRFEETGKEDFKPFFFCSMFPVCHLLKTCH